MLSEERELVRRLGAGDGRAMEHLVRLHWEAVVHYTLRVLDSRDQAEDVAQEAFIRLWTHRSRWRPTSTVRPILYRIARNLALNEARRSRTFEHRISAQFQAASAADPAEDPFQDVVSTELEALVRRAVDQLPRRRRQIFLLVRFQRRSHREAGRALGISAQAVANQISRALADLRGLLGPHLEGDSSPPFDVPLLYPAARANYSAARANAPVD